MPDTTAPTVTFADDLPDPSVVNRSTGTVRYTLTFSEPVTGLTASDFLVSTGGFTTGRVTAVSGEGTTWVVTVTPFSGVTGGSLRITLAADAVQDAEGNRNALAFDSSVFIDTTLPVAPTPLVDSILDPQVVLRTSEGNAVLALRPDDAPLSVANMLEYVALQFYDGTIFHRVVDPETASFGIVQGGGYTGTATDQGFVQPNRLVSRSATLGPIPLEADNGLSNLRGTVGMARTSVLNSATSQFYVNVADNTGFDPVPSVSAGYAVFADVLAGMATFDRIASVPTGTVGASANVPLTDVSLISAQHIFSGVAVSATGVIPVDGLEAGAVWSWKLGSGNWTLGTGESFSLPPGVYPAGSIRLRQVDAAGNLGEGAYRSTLLVAGPQAGQGTANPDALIGTQGAEVLRALAGDDVLLGLAGDDTLDGGDGSDIVQFTGPLSAYTVTRTADTLRVSDARSQGDGTDTLRNVEYLQFSDVGVNLTIQALSATIPQADLDRIVELYVGFFGRVPAADGLANWIGQYNNGKSLFQIADDFYGIGSGAALRAYTGYWDFAGNTELSNADYVRIVYRNVLGREGKAGGINYWSDQLVAGTETRGSLVCKMLDSANTFEGNPTWGWVADLVDDKVTMSRRVAVDWGLNYAVTVQQAIEQGMEIVSAVDVLGPTPGFPDIPIKVFDFTEATAIVGVNPAQIDLFA